MADARVTQLVVQTGTASPAVNTRVTQQVLLVATTTEVAARTTQYVVLTATTAATNARVTQYLLLAATQNLAPPPVNPPGATSSPGGLCLCPDDTVLDPECPVDSTVTKSVPPASTLCRF